MNFWFWATLVGGLYALFKNTAPVKGERKAEPEKLRRADLPPSASPEMKGEEDGFPDVSPNPFDGKKKEMIPASEGSSYNPFREAGEPKEEAEEGVGNVHEGNGHPEPEDGTLSEEEMNNLSEYDEGKEPE